MIINSIQLNNFRQFYGTTPIIRFASGDKNVTVLHGTNGSGKTTLLNAFKWTFYDELTTGVAYPDQIVNNRAINEANVGDKVEAWVSIELQHGKNTFLFSKRAKSEKTETGFNYLGPEKLDLVWWDESGSRHSEKYASEAINRILPKSLHPYFFFDGERIGKIIKRSDKEKKELAEATKMFVGAELFDRSIRHIQQAIKVLNDELGQEGDEELTMLNNKLIQLDNSTNELENRNAEIDDNIDALNDEKERNNKKQSEHSETKKDQARKNELEGDLKVIQDQILRCEDSIKETINSQGYISFLYEPISDYISLYESLRKKGELPSGMKRQFVEDLISDKKCICGRELLPGSEHTEIVETWKSKSGLADVEEKAIRLLGIVKEVKDNKCELLMKNLKHTRRNLIESIELRRNIEIELKEVRERLTSIPKEELSGLEKRNAEIDNTINELHMEKGKNNHKIALNNEESIETKELITRHKSRKKRQVVAQERINTARAIVDNIIKIRNVVLSRLGSKLQEKMQNIFSQMSHKPYKPVLLDDYTIQLTDSASGAIFPIDASTGEMQITSISFIGSIVEVAKEYMEKEFAGLELIDTSEYPAIIDSPYGNLGGTYRQQISRYLPKFSKQVILFLSKTQWEGEVEKEISEKVGKHYILEYLGPKGESKSESVEINSKLYELILCGSDETEHSRIYEVENG